jgi:mono/diheme cytochrome c family protein
MANRVEHERGDARRASYGMRQLLTRFAVWLSLTAVPIATQATEDVLTARQAQGKVLFEATCIYCHNPRGWATERLKLRNGAERAVLVERTDLDAAYIRTVVRNGLASMPAYTPTDLSEEEIRAIATYLTRPRGRSGNEKN